MTNYDRASLPIRHSEFVIQNLSATPVFVLPPQANCGRMKLKSLFSRFRNNEGKVVVSFGDAHLLRKGDGKFELRGGSRSERQAAREWVSFFKHESAVEW